MINDSRGKGFDGAATVSGNGMATHIINKIPKAIYTH